MGATRRPTILIVDDEPEMANYIANVAEPLGLEPIITSTAEQFIDVYSEVEAAGIVMDIVMPDMDGIELVNWLGQRECTASILLITGYDPIYANMLTTLAANAGVSVMGRLQKPFDLGALEFHLKSIANGQH